MAIVKMKKIRLFAYRHQKEEILKELMVLGCVEACEPDELLEDPEVSALTVREKGELETQRANYTSLKRSLEILDQYAPVKKKMFAARPQITRSRLFDESSKTLDIARSLELIDGKIRRIAVEIASETALCESLRPWESLTLPLDSEGTKRAGVLIGAVPFSTELDELTRELEETADESQLFIVSSGREQHYLVVVYLRERQSEVNETLRKYGFSVVQHKNLHGTAKENIKRSEQKLAELSEQRTSLISQISELNAHRRALCISCDLAQTKVAQCEAEEKLLSTKSAVILTGWMTAPDENALSAALSKYDCFWELETPSKDEYETVPVLLKNNMLTRPLTMVTEMYSLPAYGGVDPNPLMMPFFVLFYGVMMADMGYGFLMMLVAGLIKRNKPQGGMRNFTDLLLMCGISTFIVGVLTGGLFGDAPSQIASLFGLTFKMPYTPLFDPLTNTMEVLYGALILGFIQIVFGMGVSFVHQAKRGHLVDAVFDIGSWWVVFAGLAFGMLGVTWIVAIAGASMVVLTSGRSKPTLIGKIVGGIGALYNITGYFGDILSYSRLMALMLAGGVIAQVFNTLGALTGNAVTFMLIFIAGHALNFGLNLLGCFVHDLRLQCLEFFGKFYEDGGRAFKPLSIKTKYNNIVNE